jgi:uncharacterized protein YgiM (DUF1202 family)
MSIRRWFCSCAIALSLGGWAVAEDLNVQVRETAVREKPNPLANILGTLNYGDKVTLLEKLGEGWRRVEHKAPSKLAGWVRASALTAKSLDTTNFGGSRSSATAVETTEAGKGLLEKGEQAYVAKHNLQNAIAQLDSIEKNPSLNMKPEEIQSFLSQGGVTPREGK